MKEIVKEENRVTEKERGREIQLVLFHDFLAEVEDWLFHELLQLNLDKTGIIQGEEKLE